MALLKKKIYSTAKTYRFVHLYCYLAKLRWSDCNLYAVNMKVSFACRTMVICKVFCCLWLGLWAQINTVRAGLLRETRYWNSYWFDSFVNMIGKTYRFFSAEMA